MAKEKIITHLNKEVQKTEDLKNKVKLAKDRINETVVRGGGITSKSLSDIPDNITKMLGQYKKIAMISYQIDRYRITDYPDKIWTIPLNLKFTPSKILGLIRYNEIYKNPTEVWVEMKNGAIDFNDSYLRIYIHEVNNQNLKVTFSTRYSGTELQVLKWVAIE